MGTSGSGKTHFITTAIKLLKERLNYEVAVVKNIHEHEIDKKGKDSYKYCEAGAVYSITKNINDENTIFLKKRINMEELIKWLENGPFKVDLVFIEGFKNLTYPTILCVEKFSEIENQLGEEVKMISGRIMNSAIPEGHDLKLPMIDIEKEFEKFLEIFRIQ
jgi:molybdopterin-guanine dinucleotide biosynthesis protein B